MSLNGRFPQGKSLVIAILLIAGGQGETSPGWSPKSSNPH